MSTSKTPFSASAPARHEKARRFHVSKVLIHLLLLLLVVINIFPLYWMLTFSFKSDNEIMGYK